MTDPTVQSDPPYTVTVAGATGKSGRLVLEAAVQRSWQVRAAARRRPPAGTWVRLDWHDPESWEPAFRGSHAAYLLVPFTDPGAAESTPYLLEAVARAGVSRIVLLTSWDVVHAPHDSPLRVAERALASLPVEATVLRPTWFLDNFVTGSFAPMARRGVLRLPAGEGRIPLVDLRDVAAVAVAALATDGPTGSLPITGPEAIDHHRVATALQAAWGRPVAYQPVSVDAFVEAFTDQGFSAEYSRFLGEALAAVGDGTLEVPVAHTVERVLGRRAGTVEEFARHHAAPDAHPR